MNTSGVTRRQRAAKLWRKGKVPFAVVACVLLAVALYLYHDPFVTWGAALLSAGLLVIKEVLGTIGVAAETDAQNKLDATKTSVDSLEENGSAAEAELTAAKANVIAAEADLASKTVLKRNYEARAATCSMFAAIFGVPAAASVVAALYSFPFMVGS